MAKILIVADALNARSQLALTLAGAQPRHDVIQAMDGWETLAIVESELPDIIFMALPEPLLDGEATARLLKTDPLTAAIPLVAISALPLADEDVPYFDHHLLKPYLSADIQHLVTAACGQPLPGAASKPLALGERVG